MIIKMRISTVERKRIVDRRRALSVSGPVSVSINLKAEGGGGGVGC
jgi:hypothetical protein